MYFKFLNFYVSHLLWINFVLLTVFFYKSNRGVLYTIGIIMTKIIEKGVGPSVCNANMPTPPSLSTVE